MTYRNLELTVEGGLARLILNKPEEGNPFNEVTCHEFGIAAQEIAGRSDIRAILLSARGRFFSVGGDVAMFADDLDGLPDIIRRCTASLHMGMAKLMRQDAPIIACVHATAMGGALAVISNCDLVYCAQSAKLGAAYAHLAFTCDLGATVGLSTRMGIARARRFLLTGEMVGAVAAESLGLVDFVTQDALVEHEAETAARRLAEGPTQTFGEVRRLMLGLQGRGFETQLEDEAQALIRAVRTNDAREGILAFVEKRSANFSGT